MRHAVLYALACAVCVAHAKTEWRPSRKRRHRRRSGDRRLVGPQRARPPESAEEGHRLGELRIPHRRGHHNRVLIGLWDRAFARAVQSEDWKKDVQANAWAEDFMASAEARRHVEPNTIMNATLVDLGVVAR